MKAFHRIDNFRVSTSIFPPSSSAARRLHHRKSYLFCHHHSEKLVSHGPFSTTHHRRKLHVTARQHRRQTIHIASSSSSSSSPPYPTDDSLPHTKPLPLTSLRKRQSLQYKLKLLSARIAAFIKLLTESPSFKLAWTSVQFAASLLFVGLYVWGTYDAPSRGSIRYFIEVGLCTLFAFEYFYRFFFHHPDPGSKLRMVTSPRNIVDLLSFAPPLLEAILRQALPSFTFGRLDLRWFKLLRSIRVLRIGLLGTELRALNLSTKRGGWLSAGANFRLVQLAMSVFMLLFVASSIIQIVEGIPFHRAIYFVATTLSTVGYGDVIISSFLGRACVLAMIAVGIVLIPVQAAAFYTEVSARRVVRGSLPDWRGKPFILLSTRLTEVRAFSDLFAEFQQALGSARFPINTKLVALCNRPSFEFSAFQELHERAVTLVEGSAVSGQDLVTVQAERARAIMLMADRFTTDPEAEDLGILFQVWASKSYTKTVPLFVQTVRQSTVHQIAPFLDPGQDVIVSMEQTRFRLLALSAVCPGASTLVGNLLRSSAVRPPETRESTLAGRRWLRQYVNGCEHTICKAPLQRHLAGRRFIDVAEWLFRSHGYAVIGVVDALGGVRLNPAREMLAMGMTLLVIGPHKKEVRRALASAFEALPEGAVEWSRGAVSGEGLGSMHEACATPSMETGLLDGYGTGSTTRAASSNNGNSTQSHSSHDTLDDINSKENTGDTASEEVCVPVLFGNMESDSFDADSLPCVPESVVDGLKSQDDLNRYMKETMLEQRKNILRQNDDDDVGGTSGGGGGGGDDTRNYSPSATITPSQSASIGVEGYRRIPHEHHHSSTGATTSKFSGHFVVCGHGGSIVPFMSYLRTAESTSVSRSKRPENGDAMSNASTTTENGQQDAASVAPIVVLAPTAPQDFDLAQRLYGPLEYVQGSPTEASSLRAVGAATAKALVFLARGSRPVKSAQATGGTVELVRSTREAVLADASALLACYGAGEESGASLTHAVVELLFTTSIEFLQPGLLLKNVGLIYDESSVPQDKPRKSWTMRAWQQREAVAEGLAEWQANPYYAAGRVTVPALMDAFATQCFFHRGLMTDVLAELAGDLSRSSGGCFDSYDGSAAAAEDSMVYDSMYNDEEEEDDISQSDANVGALLQLVDVPPGLYGRTYGECFMAMAVGRKQVCIGLYRRKSENPGTRLSYVVANPSWNDELEASDRVFVLQERPVVTQ